MQRKGSKLRLTHLGWWKGVRAQGAGSGTVGTDRQGSGDGGNVEPTEQGTNSSCHDAAHPHCPIVCHVAFTAAASCDPQLQPEGQRAGTTRVARGRSAVPAARRKLAACQARLDDRKGKAGGQ